MSQYQKVYDLVFQFVARYGSTKHPADTLNTNTTPPWNGSPSTQPKSGLGLIKYVELENEPNRWWKGDGQKYTPQQFASLQIAMYKAAKGADPNIKVVMSGLSYMDEAYLLECIPYWGSSFPFDVVNVHHYCNEGNKEMRVELTKACSPERDNFKARCERFIAFSKLQFGDIPVWLTEAGYDSNATGNVIASPQSATANDAAKWNTELTTIAINAGFEKVMLYKLFDLGDAGLFQASGNYYKGGQLKSPIFNDWYNKLKD
jgi:hypothetical protein